MAENVIPPLTIVKTSWKKKRALAEYALNQMGLNAEGLIIVMVTHSPECASYAQRLLRISDGLLVEQHS